MASAELASKSTAPAAPAAPSAEAPAAAGPGQSFDLDGFADFSGTCEQPAPTSRTGVELLVDNFGAAYTAMLAKLIDLAAPTRGSELEAGLLVRIPIQGALLVTGKLALKASRDTEGKVTASVAGSFGPSVGGVGLYGDLLVGGQLQGEGATAERAVAMLSLALETCVRASDNADDFFSKLRVVWNAAMLDPISIAILAGYGPADALADFLWGKGNAAKAERSMQDGEAAQMTGSATLGGAAKPEVAKGTMEVGAKGSAGLTVQRRIENTGGGAQTKNTPSFIANGEVTIGPVTGAFDIQIPIDDPANMKVAGSLKAMVDPEAADWVADYVTCLAALIKLGNDYVAGAPSGAAKAASTALAGLQAALGTAIIGVESRVLKGIKSLNVPNLDASVGIEWGIEVQGDKGQTQFAYVGGVEATIPSGGSQADVTKKQVIVGPIPFNLK